ncbi:hypothetical protein [Streptantibioticus ferralitis]|uniref:Uncharacterized protein n=1 Tax=Streptantibioticus ferralitis TaxID=236510 RepID=A0ABT5YYV4_9ACTN|nr:hypothetical protein [Streptantibioticus ferralitis]MDF2256693.1 hypothetical protein [Streptantibioticus ferralitis]
MHEGRGTGRPARVPPAGLHDDHVAQLLNEAVYHIEHLKIEHSAIGAPDKA